MHRHLRVALVLLILQRMEKLIWMKIRLAIPKHRAQTESPKEIVGRIVTPLRMQKKHFLLGKYIILLTSMVNVYEMILKIILTEM